MAADGPVPPMQGTPVMLMEPMPPVVARPTPANAASPVMNQLLLKFNASTGVIASARVCANSTRIMSANGMALLDRHTETSTLFPNGIFAPVLYGCQMIQSGTGAFSMRERAPRGNGLLKHALPFVKSPLSVLQF